MALKEFQASCLLTNKNVDLLGRGGFGAVYRCYDTDNQYGRVAVKIFSPRGPADGIRSEIRKMKIDKEVLLHFQLGIKRKECPHIVRIYGVVSDESETWMGSVMECLPRNLLNIAGKRTASAPQSNIPWSLRLRIMSEVAMGLAYLHSFENEKRITHNDLKPANVLLDENFHAKICDFGGASKALFTSLFSLSMTMVSDRGNQAYTPGYAAPEFLENKQGWRSRAMDVYSYGMTMYFVVSGVEPDVKEADVIEGSRPDLEDINGNESLSETEQSAATFLVKTVRECWVQEPENRPEISEIVQKLEGALSKVAEEDLKRYVAAMQRVFPLDDESAEASRNPLSEIPF